MRRFTITSCLCLLFCVAAPEVSEAASAGRDYGASIKALQQEKWDKAEKSIRDALEKENKAMESILISGSVRFRYMPYYVLGAALKGQGDCPGAVAAWQESLNQGQVQNSSKEYAELQAGMAACGGALAAAGQQPGPPSAAAPEPAAGTPVSGQPGRTAEYNRLANETALALDELRSANVRYAELRGNPDLAGEWAGEWKPPLDVSRREWEKLEADLDAETSKPDSAADIAALRAIAGRLEDAITGINSSRRQAEQRITDIQQARLAQNAAREEERKRQEALDEQRRQIALRDRQEAEKRKREQARRDAIASAQQTLKTALDRAAPSLTQSSGDGTVISARSELAVLIVSGESLLASDSVDDINRAAQNIRDAQRRYSQALQEWDAAQREIAYRTPPDELKSIADAYFSGDYEKVLNIARPERFADARQTIQAYLFRSAARFNAYWLSGAEDSRLLAGARQDIAAIKRLDSNFIPYVAAFSPKYMNFFQDS